MKICYNVDDLLPVCNELDIPMYVVAEIRLMAEFLTIITIGSTPPRSHLAS